LRELPLKKMGQVAETFIAGVEMGGIRLKKNHAHQGRASIYGRESHWRIVIQEVHYGGEPALSEFDTSSASSLPADTTDGSPLSLTLPDVWSTPDGQPSVRPVTTGFTDPG
jgi:hypothetical protein